MGDVLQATPLCHALWLLGFDVDLLVSLPWLAPLLDGLPPIRRVLTDRAAVDFGGYRLRGERLRRPATPSRASPPASAVT
jgi:hypothetical protein